MALMEAGAAVVAKHVRICPDCWATMSRGRCRACGWVEGEGEFCEPDGDGSHLWGPRGVLCCGPLGAFGDMCPRHRLEAVGRPVDGSGDGAEQSVEVTWSEYRSDPERVMRMAEDGVVTVVGWHPHHRMELSCPRGDEDE